MTLITPSCNWMPGPMDVKCDTNVVREYPSPDASVKAVESHSTCEGGSYVATIDVFTGAARNGATAMHAHLVGRSQPPAWPVLKLEWKSNKELWITYPTGVDTTCISTPPGIAVHCLDASIER